MHGIERVFKKTKLSLKNDKYLSLLFFDEIGMAELSPNNPLKVLHKLFDDFAVNTKGKE